LQPDHINELDCDRKRPEGEDSVSDSAILSAAYKKLRKTRAQAIAQATRRKNAINLRINLRATKSVSYLVKTAGLVS
jgi:hypothetical protein